MYMEEVRDLDEVAPEKAGDWDVSIVLEVVVQLLQKMNHTNKGGKI
jgi:hypothetical protein